MTEMITEETSGGSNERGKIRGSKKFFFRNLSGLIDHRSGGVKKSRHWCPSFVIFIICILLLPLHVQICLSFLPAAIAVHLSVRNSVTKMKKKRNMKFFSSSFFSIY